MIAEHLSLGELERRQKDASSIEQFRRWQVILIRVKNPSMSVREVAGICGVAYKTVTQWSWLYNTQGPENYILTGRGGRHRCHLSEEKEQQLLQSIQKKAGQGIIVTVQSVKKAAEKMIGRELPKDYAYDLLHRWGWRKVMPHTYHPDGDENTREAFKKTSRVCWRPPDRN